MKEQVETIRENLKRTLWETENMMNCLKPNDWNTEFCGSPVWKHIYHTLHSLDRWFIKQEEYNESSFHKYGQNSFDVKTEAADALDRETLFEYLNDIRKKLYDYLDGLNDERLKEEINGKTRFARILFQFKHLHTHLGLIMAFIYMRNGKWVYMLGSDRMTPDEYGAFFE